jgi:hypothetical protein
MARLNEYPLPLRVLYYARNAALYLFTVGVSVACLVVGTTVARIIGAVLLGICLLIAGRLAWRRFANFS